MTRTALMSLWLLLIGVGVYISWGSLTGERAEGELSLEETCALFAASKYKEKLGDCRVFYKAHDVVTLETIQDLEVDLSLTPMSSYEEREILHAEKENAFDRAQDSIAQAWRAQPTPPVCKGPQTPYITPWLYDYRILSDSKIFIYNKDIQVTLDLPELGAALREMTEKPQKLIYLNAHKYKVLFPLMSPIIEIQGTMRISYTHRNVYAINGKVGREYVFPVTTPGGDLAIFWNVDGVSDDDSLLAFNLKSGELTIIGAYASRLDHMPIVNQPDQESWVDIPTDLGGSNPQLRVWESEVPPGFKIRIRDHHHKAYLVYDPLKRALVTCGPEPAH